MSFCKMINNKSYQFGSFTFFSFFRIESTLAFSEPESEFDTLLRTESKVLISCVRETTSD